MLHLNRVASDHSPLLVTCKAATDQVPRSFRFLNVWVAHHSFLDVVREAWSFQSDCRPIKALLLKLKKVKEMLRVWNKDVFGNVVDRVREAEEDVRCKEVLLEENQSEEALLSLNQAEGVLRLALSREAAFWKQKSRIKWGMQTPNSFMLWFVRRGLNYIFIGLEIQRVVGWRIIRRLKIWQLIYFQICCLSKMV